MLPRATAECPVIARHVPAADERGNVSLDAILPLRWVLYPDMSFKGNELLFRFLGKDHTAREQNISIYQGY